MVSRSTGHRSRIALVTRIADLSGLCERVRQREPRAIGRAISLVEEVHPARQQLIERIYPETGRARVVGITGPPGAGKSTLVDRLARLFRERGETVGILAVDPTSPFTGGAILGDRIRMQKLYTDPGVFIRSMATRGAMGGLARALCPYKATYRRRSYPCQAASGNGLAKVAHGLTIM